MVFKTSRVSVQMCQRIHAGNVHVGRCRIADYTIYCPQGRLLFTYLPFNDWMNECLISGYQDLVYLTSTGTETHQRIIVSELSPTILITTQTC